MTPEQFCFWLHGWFELCGDDVILTRAQSQMVREHLDLVFTKVTPPLKRSPEEAFTDSHPMTRDDFSRMVLSGMQRGPTRCC